MGGYDGRVWSAGVGRETGGGMCIIQMMQRL